MDIHPSDEEALQTIDAAVFTGDPDIIRERLTHFIERWTKALSETAHDCEASRVTCGNCDSSWCERCDPGPSALCHTCHGRGHSTAPLEMPITRARYGPRFGKS